MESSELSPYRRVQHQICEQKGCLPACRVTTGWRRRRCARSFEHNTESYDQIVENAFRSVAQHPLSTFSIDVDTASYSNVRRFLREGAAAAEGRGAHRGAGQLLPLRLPARRRTAQPFSVTTERRPSPWNAKHRLVRIGLQGTEIARRAAAAAQPRVPDRRVGLDGAAEQAAAASSARMKLLVENAAANNDRVAIVVYAGARGLVLPPTRGDGQGRRSSPRSTRSRPAARRTAAPASSSRTRRRAKQLHQGRHQPRDPRTDGDFNVGMTSEGELVRLIEEKRRDRRVPDRARLRHGQPQGRDAGEARRQGQRQLRLHRHASPRRARCWSTEAGATLVTIAKDVKIQVEFNPAHVSALPADRLREPHARERGLQRRQEGRRRDRRRPHA